MSELLLSSPAALGADGRLGPGWVRLREGAVVDDGAGAAPGTPDLEAAYLSPAFVDIHCHGGAGASFATTDPQEALAAARFHGEHGTRTVVASLVTAPLEQLEEQIRALVPLAREGIVAGVHLEGPWLSPLHRGAHDPEHLLAPRDADVERLVTAAEGHLRMVTLAPELPGALAATELLVQRGVVVAVGHTDADAVQLRSAVDAGARVVTHLCNAMRPMHHRAPGPVPTALGDPRVAVELVADGLHLHPEMLALLVRAARSQVLLVTDATAAAGAPDGRRRLGSVEVDVVEGVARVSDTGALAGSTLTLGRAVRTAVASGVPVARALASATLLPARALGLGPGAQSVLALDEHLQVLRT